jgi:hypothetical protein
MKNFIKKIINELIDSLHNRPGGFSARKLTAIATMILVVYLHIYYVDLSNVVSILIYDMVFILLLLSIVTIDQLYKFKFGNRIENKEEEPEQDDLKPEQDNQLPLNNDKN